MSLQEFNDELFDSLFTKSSGSAKKEDIELEDGFYHGITVKGKQVTRKRSGQDMLILELAMVGADGKPDPSKTKAYFFDLPSVSDQSKWVENFNVLLEKSEKIASQYGTMAPEAGAEKFFKDIYKRTVAYSGPIVRLARDLLGVEEIPRGYIWSPELTAFVDNDGNEIDREVVQEKHKEISKKAYNWLRDSIENPGDFEGYEVYLKVQNNQVKYLTSRLPEGADLLAV